jgi:hypothetical protein
MLNANMIIVFSFKMDVAWQKVDTVAYISIVFLMFAKPILLTFIIY